jgi:uncharacterized protein with PQ loop repeat
VKTLLRQSAGDISVLGLFLALFCAGSWFIYSLMLRDKPLILSNCLGFFLTAVNLAITMHYQ